MLTAGALNQVYTGTTVVPVLPTHTTGDILIAVGMHNGAGTLAVSGWTEIAHESNSNISSGAWYKVATSGAESNPTITSSGAASSTSGLFAQTFKAPGTAYNHIGTAIWNGPTSSTTPTGSTVVTTGASALAVTFGLVDTANTYSSGLPPASWTTVSDVSSENFSVPTVAAVSSAIDVVQTGTTLNVTLPAHQADDIIVVVAAQTLSSATLTCGTSGWAKFDGTGNAALSTGYFWKRAASSSETAPTITTTNTASGTDSLYAVAFVIRGCITTGNPYDEFHKSTMALTASATTTSTTTAGFDRLLFAAFAVNDNNNFNTVPTNWTEHLDINTITGSDVQFAAMSRTVASPTTIGAATWTNSASDTLESITIAFIPAAAGEGRITTIEQVKATPGTVSGATIATLPSASYWKSLSLTLEPSTGQTVNLNSVDSAESVNSPTVVNILGSDVINFIAQSSNIINTTASWTVNSPSTSVIQAGDLIIVGAMTGGLDTISSGPSGFFDLTEINENSEATLKLWYTFASGSDPSTYSLTWSASTSGVGFCVVYRNVTNITGTSASNQTAATTAHDWGPITPQKGKAVVVGVIGCNPQGPSLNWTWDSPYVERMENTNGSLAAVSLGDRPVSTPTSTAIGGDYPGSEGAAVVVFSLESYKTIDLIINSISSAEAVSSPTITKRNTITLSTGQEITSAESVSQPTLTKRNTITLSAGQEIASAETFANPTITSLRTIVLTGNEIASAESVSNPTLTKLNTIILNSINSAETFDSPTLTNRATINANSINSSEAFDSPTITSRATIVLNSINSAEAFDSPTITKRNTIVLNAISSSETFDNPTVTNRATIVLNSINGAETFDTPTITQSGGGQTVTLSSGQEIASAESVSNPTVSSRFTISTHSFGDSYGPEVLKDSPLWYNRYETGAVAGSLYDHSKNTQPNVVSTAVAVTAIDGPLSNDGPGQGLQRTNDQLGTFLAGTPTNQPSTAITVEIWFKTNIQGNWPNWVNNGWVSQGAYLLYASTTGPIFGLINPSPSQNNAFAARTYNDEKWHHTVGTYDGTAVVVYYDGVAIGTVNNANTQNVTLKTGSNIVLGGGVSAGTANYRALAEYATYGTALSPARILAHYEAAFDVPNATVGNRNTISLNSINSSETFENPIITSRNSIILTGKEISSGESVSNPQLSIVITGSINSAESVSSPTVTSLRTIILTGNEIASAESVSNPTLVKFNTITPNSVNSAEAFDNPTLTHRATIILTGNEIGSAENVSQPTVSNARTIVLTGQEIGSGFAADNPTVSSRATIAPNSINSAETFNNPTIQKLNTIVLNSINSAESVNNPIVVNVNTIVPNSINSSEVVDNPSISNLATIVLNSINSAESVNNPTVLNQNTISVNSIDSAEAFSNPNVLPIFPVSITSAEFVDQPVILTGAFLIQPNAIDSAESVNNPTITTGGVTIALNSVNSGEAFENPIVTSLRVITLNSINSSETFDNPVVSNKNTITPNSIASSEVVNNPIVLNLATIILNSIASSEAVDNPSVTTRTTINLSSYDGSDTPNNPVVSTFNLISLNSVNSAESVNNPIVSSSSIVNLNPINPDEIVNEIVLTTLSQIYPDTFGGDTFSTDLEVFLVVPGPQGAGGISSLEALGLPRIGFGINPNSITSEEVVSSPFIVSPITIWIVNPISSSEGFGSVIITNNRIQPISGISVSGTSIVYPPIHSAGGTGVVIIGSAIVVPSPGTPANPGGSVTIGTIEGVRTPLL